MIRISRLHTTKTVCHFMGMIALLLLVGCIPEETVVSILVPAEQSPTTNEAPTIADYWEGNATFLLDIEDTKLPMGESETIVVETGHYWSYVHASDRSAGAVDQCGTPVEFPGCTVIYYSEKGDIFNHQEPLVCQFECKQCPCESETDHIDQQQYPDVHYDEESETIYLVYEYRGSTKLRTSKDGLSWSDPADVGDTGHWRLWLKDCNDYERIGEHPFVPPDYECLAGAPPGVFVEDGIVYVFVATGQAPGNMSCYKGRVGAKPQHYKHCKNNPLFTGATTYGDLNAWGEDAHPYWDFRTISSAEIVPIGKGKEKRYYLFYEGIRGPGPGAAGDNQFGIGLARSLTNELDGEWEKFDNNPLIIDLPGNIGLGHTDIVIDNGITYMYTSLDGVVRSRLVLVWSNQ